MAKAFEEWWKENRGWVNRERRRRYKSDPEYRRKLLEMQKKPVVVTKVVMKPRSRSRYLCPVWITVAGTEMQVLSLGVLADRLGVSDELLRYWIRTGAIPPATWVNSEGRQFVSRKYIQMLVSVPRVRPLRVWAERVWRRYEKMNGGSRGRSAGNGRAGVGTAHPGGR